MSAMLNFIKQYYIKIFAFSCLYFLLGNILYPSISNLLIYKNNFIYLMAESPLIWQVSVYWFTAFIWSIVFMIFWAINQGI